MKSFSIFISIAFISESSTFLILAKIVAHSQYIFIISFVFFAESGLTLVISEVIVLGLGIFPPVEYAHSNDLAVVGVHSGEEFLLLGLKFLVSLVALKLLDYLLDVVVICIVLKHYVRGPEFGEHLEDLAFEYGVLPLFSQIGVVFLAIIRLVAGVGLGLVRVYQLLQLVVEQFVVDQHLLRYALVEVTRLHFELRGIQPQEEQEGHLLFVLQIVHQSFDQAFDLDVADTIEDLVVVCFICDIS
mmetsp:Transcript_76982/g.166548  ORF Transcript_76982/g.166548 Transcript_76982/m.166548 type:complete len:244 (-) Transcript_76982:379-1110(-)